MIIKKVMDDYTGELFDPDQTVTLNIAVDIREGIDSPSGRTEAFDERESIDVSLQTLSKIWLDTMVQLKNEVSTEKFLEVGRYLAAKYKLNPQNKRLDKTRK